MRSDRRVHAAASRDHGAGALVEFCWLIELRQRSRKPRDDLEGRQRLGIDICRNKIARCKDVVSLFSVHYRSLKNESVLPTDLLSLFSL